MRDIALLTIVLCLIFLAVCRPWLGVLGLAVLGFMHPQGYSEGFMRTFPAYMALFVATVGGYVAERFRKKRWPQIYLDWRLVALALLWGWFFVSTHFAIAPSAAREKLVEVLKILPPLVLVWLLIDTREKLHWLLATIALSIALVTLKGGYWAAMTGFHDRVYGPPGSQYGDNNEFAVAVAMTIPMLVLWMRESRDRSLRGILLALIGLSYLSALSSWSRGGMLSLVAMTILLLWYAQRKWLGIALAGAGVVGVLAAFPEKWLGRMETLLAFQEEASAQSRMSMWRIGWESALARPLTGSGFDAWPILSAAKGGIMDWHSAYIEVLAEHGFVGLAMWGALYAGVLVSLGLLARFGRRSRRPWVVARAGLLQAALAAYLAGALTLGIAYWELPLWLILCAALTARMAKHDASAGAMPPEQAMRMMSKNFTAGRVE